MLRESAISPQIREECFYRSQSILRMAENSELRIHDKVGEMLPTFLSDEIAVPAESALSPKVLTGEDLGLPRRAKYEDLLIAKEAKKIERVPFEKLMDLSLKQYLDHNNPWLLVFTKPVIHKDDGKYIMYLKVDMNERLMIGGRDISTERFDSREFRILGVPFAT